MTIHREERIGNQRLILGDSLQVMPLLGRFDAVVTDPPYGIDYNPTRSQTSAASGSRKAQKKVAGDAVPFDPSPFLGVASQWLFWGANNFSDKLPGSAGWLAWDKRDSGTLFRGFMASDFELAACNTAGRTHVLSHKWCGHLRQSERDLFVHPTQKPIAVMEWCLGFLPDAKTIFDPFAGSGTTLVACQRMGRHGTGIELDPDYFDIACKRVDEAARQPDLLIPETRTAPIQQGLDL